MELNSELLIAQHYMEYNATPDFDIISVWGGAVSFLSHITRELANFSQPIDNLWDIDNKLIFYILYTSKDASK